jgi:hypothetical protein
MARLQPRKTIPKGGLFQDKTTQDSPAQQEAAAQEDKDDEEQHVCPICFDTLIYKPLGKKFLRSSWG